MPSLATAFFIVVFLASSVVLVSVDQGPHLLWSSLSCWCVTWGGYWYWKYENEAFLLLPHGNLVPAHPDFDQGIEKSGFYMVP